MNSAEKASTQDEKLKARAYAIWEQEGRPDGRHLDHWQRAAREIEDVKAPATKPPAKKAAPAATTVKEPQPAQRRPSSSKAKA